MTRTFTILQKHMLALIALILLFVAGCTGPSTLEATLPPGERPEPTPLPEVAEWRQAAAPITLDNIPAIEKLGNLRGPEPPSTAFDYALSPDQTQLVALNNDLIVSWELVEGEMLFAVSRQGANRVYFSPDKDEIYTLDSEGLIRIFDSTDGTNKDTLRALDAYNDVAGYAPLDGLMVLGGQNGAVRIWDLFERIARVTFNVEGGAAVTGLALSDEGLQVAAADASEHITIWDLKTREPLTRFDAGAVTNSLAFAPDGQSLVVNNSLGLRIYATDSGDLLHTLNAAFSPQVFTFVPESPYLVVDGGNSDLSIFDVQTGELATILAEITGERRSVAVSPDGDLLFASALGSAASLWNLSNLAEGSVARSTFSIENTNIFNMAWTDDGFQILIFDARGPIDVWGLVESGG